MTGKKHRIRRWLSILMTLGFMFGMTQVDQGSIEGLGMCVAMIASAFWAVHYWEVG